MPISNFGSRALGALLVLFASAGACVADEASKEEAKIRAAMHSIEVAVGNRDAVAAMAPYTEDTRVYDISPPRVIIGRKANIESYEAFIGATEGPVTLEYSDVNLKVFPASHCAFGDYTVHLAAKLKGGGKLDLLLRSTDLWEKHDGKWLIAVDHASLPVDMKSGMAVARAPRILKEGQREEFWKGHDQWP